MLADAVAQLDPTRLSQEEQADLASRQHWTVYQLAPPADRAYQLAPFGARGVRFV